MQISNRTQTIRRKIKTQSECASVRKVASVFEVCSKQKLITINCVLVYITMAFFNSAVGVLQTLVVALGAGLGIWGAINLMEGYGNDNPGSKSQGMKQLMAGGGVALIGITLVPLLSGLF